MWTQVSRPLSRAWKTEVSSCRGPGSNAVSRPRSPHRRILLGAIADRGVAVRMRHAQPAHRLHVPGRPPGQSAHLRYLFPFSKYPRADRNRDSLIGMVYYRFKENVRRGDGAGESRAGKRAGGRKPESESVSRRASSRHAPAHIRHRRDSARRDVTRPSPAGKTRPRCPPAPRIHPSPSRG